MALIGLTGGTGSGKSLAASHLAEFHNIPLIDADELGHALTDEGGAAVNAIASSFGDGLIVNGAVNRRALGRVVFCDPKALERLNQITRPLIHEAIQREYARIVDEQRAGLVIVHAAILGDSGEREPWLDGLILVEAEESVRIERLVCRRGLSREEARVRVKAQAPALKVKRSFADWLVYNNGSKSEFLDAIDKWLESYITNASSA